MATEGTTHGDSAEDGVDERTRLLLRSVDELEVSVRTATCLQEANIRFVGARVQKSEGELLAIEGHQRRCLAEIQALLGEMGLSLGTQAHGLKAEAREARP